MQYLFNSTVLFFELFIPLVIGFIWLVIELDVFPMENTKRQTRVLRIVLAFAIGGTLGLFSRFLSPPQTTELSVYVLTLVAGPIVLGTLLAQVAKYRLRKRNQIRYGNFWLFFWVTLSYLVARVPLSLFLN